MFLSGERERRSFRGKLTEERGEERRGGRKRREEAMVVVVAEGNKEVKWPYHRRGLERTMITS